MTATEKRLAKLLDSDDMDLRVAAIRVITEIRLHSRPIIQGLARCLREPHEGLRLAALGGLAKMGAREAAPLVVPLILEPGLLREQAMAVLSAVGASVIPQLKALYPSADFHGKRAIISALAKIGSKPALEHLVKVMPQESFEIQKHLALSICEALDRLAPGQQTPIFSLILRLIRDARKTGQPQILVAAAILLGHFRGGALGPRARQELRKLGDPKNPPEVQRHAMVSFHRILHEGRFTPIDEDFLWKALTNEDWVNIAQHALSAFQRMHLPKKAMPRLVKLLHDSPHFSVHIHVFERLRSIDNPVVAEAILPFLADPRYRVREAAEGALRGMPTSIDSLFGLLLKTEDLEMTQRINAIIREFPQANREKYVERACARLLSLFEDNDPHYRSFLEFVKSLDPEPLRAKIYQKAHTLKRSKARDRWERITALLLILWDNHLITAEGRYLLSVAAVKSSSKELAPAARRANLGLRVVKALIYDDPARLIKRLVDDKDLGAEDYYYLGFHFSEEGDEMRPFATAMLQHVITRFPRSSQVPPASQKLRLQAAAAALKEEKAAAASRSKSRSKKAPKVEAAASAEAAASTSPAAESRKSLPRVAAQPKAPPAAAPSRKPAKPAARPGAKPPAKPPVKPAPKASKPAARPARPGPAPAGRGSAPGAGARKGGRPRPGSKGRAQGSSRPKAAAGKRPPARKATAGKGSAAKK